MVTHIGGCASDMYSGRAVVEKFVDSKARPTRIKPEYVSIRRLVSELGFLGFRLRCNKPFGPATAEGGKPSGRMLLLLKGLVLVRIKTRGGNPREFGAHKQKSTKPWWIKRSGVAHMTVSLLRRDASGRPDLSKDGETAMFNASGQLEPTRPGATDAETWSDVTHFNFPDLYCDDEGVDAMIAGPEFS